LQKEKEEMTMDLKERLKFVGKPYKNEEEKELYEKTFKESRERAIARKANQGGRESVQGSGEGVLKVMKKLLRSGKKAKGKMHDFVGSFAPMELDMGGSFEPDMGNVMPDFMRKKKR
jgi:hypothetical protein